MTKINIIMITTVLLLLTPLANAAQTPEQALVNYYEASKAGDAEAFFKAVDLDYVHNNIAEPEDYENFVKAALAEYDLTTYALHNLAIKEVKEANIAVAFFDVSAKVVPAETGGTLDIYREMAALLTYTKGEWKVAFVIDRRLFWTQQEAAMTLLTLNETLDIMEEQIQRVGSVYIIEETTQTPQTTTAQTKTTTTTSTTRSTTTTQETKPPETPQLPELPISIPDISWLDLRLILPLIILIIIIAAASRRRKRK
ncbi:MAG: hypothetical protein QXK91_03115 [Nitrososphaerales archaeon]